MGRGGQTAAAHRADFETAQPGQHLERPIDTGRMQHQRALDGRTLTQQASIVGSSADTGDRGGGKAGEYRSQRAGSGRISNSHFADSQEAATFGHGPFRHLGAHRNCRDWPRSRDIAGSTQKFLVPRAIGLRRRLTSAAGIS